MKVLIVYDTISPSRVTENVATTIMEVLQQKGLTVESSSVGNVDKEAVKKCDCLLVGAPTMQFRATSGIMQFLDSLPSNEVSGKLAAAFDTQLKMFISGSAVKGIEGKLKPLGFKLVASPLVAYVEGKSRENEWHLKEGEIENTKNWASELVNKLSK